MKTIATAAQCSAPQPATNWIEAFGMLTSVAANTTARSDTHGCRQLATPAGGQLASAGTTECVGSDVAAALAHHTSNHPGEGLASRCPPNVGLPGGCCQLVMQRLQVCRLARLLVMLPQRNRSSAQNINGDYLHGTGWVVHSAKLQVFQQTS